MMPCQPASIAHLVDLQCRPVVVQPPHDVCLQVVVLAATRHRQVEQAQSQNVHPAGKHNIQALVCILIGKQIKTNIFKGETVSLTFLESVVSVNQTITKMF